MLFELCLLPLQSEANSSVETITDAVRLIHSAGLPYQVNAFGTCVEGEWDQVMAIAKQGLEMARKRSTHVVLIIKVEDDGSTASKITGNVNAVAAMLARSPAPQGEDQPFS